MTAALFWLLVGLSILAGVGLLTGAFLSTLRGWTLQHRIAPRFLHWHAPMQR